MVMLAITSKGLGDAMRLSAKTGEAVWCGAEAISESEFEAQVPGSVTRFVYGLRAENASLLDDAIETISEHHPGQSVWVEATSAA